MNKTILAVTALLAASLQTNATTLSVDGVDNIYGAGHSTPPAPGGGSAGTLPPSFTFAAGSGKVLTFSSVTGTATLTTAFGFFGPDGNTSFAMNLGSYGGISGIKSDASSFLAGVFLEPAQPLDPAPAVLNFTSAGLGTSFATLSPLIDQMFYIGDGLTGTGSGSQQQFYVPATATALYLGFPDGSGYQGLPGQYQDNGGTLTATFNVPEPSCAVLLAGGCVALFAKRRRTRA
jgi:hypothetical protein